MRKKFFPAIFVYDFEHAHAALASIGIVGAEADFALVGVQINQEQAVVFEFIITDPDADLSDLPVSKSGAVLLERQDGSIGLWLGMFNHLNDTYEGAQQCGIDELLPSVSLSDGNDEPPTLSVFELPSAVRTLQ